MGNHLFNHRFDAFWTTYVQPDGSLLWLKNQPKCEKLTACSLEGDECASCIREQGDHSISEAKSLFVPELD
jgi:hypothetical protein